MRSPTRRPIPPTSPGVGEPLAPKETWRSGRSASRRPPAHTRSACRPPNGCGCRWRSPRWPLCTATPAFGLGSCRKRCRLPTGRRYCPTLPPSGPSGRPSSTPTRWRRWVRWTSARNGTGDRQRSPIRTRTGRDEYGCSTSRPCWPCTPGGRPTPAPYSTGCGRWPLGYKFWSRAWFPGLGTPSPPIYTAAESTTPG